MSAVHGDVFWLDANGFALNWATNGVTELNHPEIFGLILLDDFRDKDAVVTASLDMDETLHVFD